MTSGASASSGQKQEPRMSNSSTITSRGNRRKKAMDTAHAPIHPGEILAEEFLGPLGITKYRLAKTIDVPATRIGEIIRGTRNVSPDTALRLSKALGTSERFWMNLQSHYDLEVQRELHQAELERIKPLVAS
ncbi:addiction module antidote protein, HigA family [Naasia lichenicola]|uniref:Addiction module antidote protein, HigA family n=2 Tax=Naasia lichenicola TaxID=2565933 RepID=A0A4S4FQG1_9MICO|nr:addiction module antidote protein, HigA family [Naasia lichenicola]